MNIIEPFINSKDAMSLQADTGRFWCRWGPNNVLARQDVRDGQYTSFIVSKTSDNKVLLKADTGKYLCLWGPERHLLAALDTPNNWCEFTVHDAGGGLIALQGTEELFLSRWGEYGLRAACGGINQYCKFVPRYGSLVDPKFEILDIKFDRLPITYIPDTGDEATITNDSSLPMEHTATLSYTRKETQKTFWNNSWSFGASIECSFGVPLVNETNFSVKITYNGEVGGSSSLENTTEFKRSVTVKAAEHKKTAVRLLIYRSVDTTVKFVAKIKRTESDGTSRTSDEEGTWTGVVYTNASISVTEEDL